MKKAWWKELVGYQIYPRSFKDSNGDGIGDIGGIIEKLDYLKDLGVGLIWVCPMYKSPNDDNGYDISDYEEILSDFGTMKDFDRLLNEVHKRKMKIILDLVINHTSDKHPWFIESKSSRENEKSDWYIWREGKDGKEPNNWESIFKGSVWEYSKEREEYFMHLFTKKQPDLNWKNEEMRKELYKMINWWIKKGIDGFRVDAISHIKKEEGLKDMDNPLGLKYVPAFDKMMNVDGIQNYLKELKEETFDKYDIVTVGEANGVMSNHAKEWVGEKDGKFNMIFQFEHLNLWNYEEGKEFSPKKYKDVMSRWQYDLEEDGWNALFIENHDIPRSVSTWGNDRKYLKESAKSFATCYFLQKGTPFIYQGQEIGMTNVKFDSIDKYNDVKSINLYKERIENGVLEEEAMMEVYATSRDNARTPMQWSNNRNAGFSDNKPWIGINENYKTINVKEEIEDKDSILNYYKNLIKLRNNSECLIYGKFELILKDNLNIFAYKRVLNNEEYIIICNLTEENTKYKYLKTMLKYDKLVLSNYKIERHIDLNEIELKSYECRVYKI
ncbi:MAG: glycoside hydrolase family 13 protein [Clostridium sp.]|uniref:glycoside hydrolase family 13 protein n=1 Tax=Clostridium sp. TaxID=1506 RepID=UPI003EE80045